MEKRKPTHDLGAFKRAFCVDRTAAVTATALRTAAEMGMGLADMERAIATLERRHFFKSMTSHSNHRIWHDVYHLPFEGCVIYLKFVDDALTEFTLLSFKEK
jgi:motility quorum-sensing regulator / GCU-specific mRNA interferase toxin